MSNRSFSIHGTASVEISLDPEDNEDQPWEWTGKEAEPFLAVYDRWRAAEQAGNPLAWRIRQELNDLVKSKIALEVRDLLEDACWDAYYELGFNVTELTEDGEPDPRAPGIGQLTMEEL